MTHEAGIEAAAETLVIEMTPDAPDMQGARHSARLIVEAYLSASGMVLVPREPTKSMLQAAKHKPLEVVEEDVYAAMLAAAPNPFKSK